MAEEQKNVEVPKDIKTEETAPAVIAATADEPTKDAIVTDAPTAPEEPKLVGAEEPKTEEAKPAEGEEAKAEEKKEEVKPIEEGQLSHKAQGASFPKNFLGSKEFFFFGTDAFEKDALASYTKNEKNISTAQANVAWATETGKGLLFSGDKKAPTGIINLSDASEPETEGANKFVLTSKGNKHSFKAANTAERDNWVAQLKSKIAEAKELATTVTESEKYKTTIESYKPKPVAKKEETPAAAPAISAEAPKEEAKLTEEAKPEEPVKDEAAKETAAEEKPKKAESPKPQNKKRASFFGFLDKKEKPEEKKEETKVEEPTKTEENPDAPTAPEEPKLVGVEEPKAETEAAKPTEEIKPEEAKSEEPKAESPKEKSSKRNSFFGGILSKKEKKAAEPKAEEKKEETAEEPKTEETAPVIPPVEATTPLAVDVNNTASTPAAETAESPAAATNGEKKDPKEKRKSSLPFLGKREKSPAPAEGEDKSPKSAFSKIRATIKGKSAAKEEKKEETPKEEIKEEETPKVEDKKEDEAVVAEPAKVEPVKDDAAKPAEPETENKPENVAAPAPAVTAAA